MNEQSNIRLFGTFKPERYAVGVGLLSMDLVEPVRACLELAPLDLAEIRPALRRAIVKNRKAFVENPEIDPDLRTFVRSQLDADFGADRTRRLENWLDHCFIYRPDDFRRHSVLEDMLARPSMWDRICVPRQVRAGLVETLARSPASACLRTHWDDDYGALSDWDSVIFARMRFYAENRDPFIYLNLTCAWLDFRRALKWLVSQTTQEERSTLSSRISLVAKETGRTLEQSTILPIEQLVVGDA